MNERINELNREAQAWALRIVGEDDDNFNLWVEMYKVKLAELIVRECADLFVDQQYMILNPHEPFADERVRALKQHDKDTVKKIKQHFGVEE